MSRENITGVILAGGKNSRMGSDKGLLEVEGKKIVDRIIAVLKLQVGNIIIISNKNNYNNLGYPVYSDIIKDCGPMGGIFTALNYSKTDQILVISCDMPFISEPILASIIEKSDDGEIIIPEHGNGKLEPLCALYSKTCLGTFAQLLTKRDLKIKDALKYFSIMRIEFKGKDSPEHHFLNVNTPSEYQSIKQIHHEYSN